MRERVDHAVEFRRIAILNGIRQHEDAARFQQARNFFCRSGADFRRELVEEKNAYGRVHAAIR